MNISYLLSILDLYLLKEKNSTLVIEVDNILEIVKVKFYYSFDSSNKTFVKIDKKLFFDHILEFLQKIQGNLRVEGETLKTINNQPVYELVFTKQRKLSFINFTSDEMQLIRKNLNNLETEFDFKIEEITYDQQLVINKNNKLSFSMGFSSYVVLITTSVLFLDIFMISLWIFKVFIK